MARASAETGLMALLSGLREHGERAALLRREIRTLLAEVLPGRLDRAETERMTFRDLGLESLMGVELRNRLENLLGIRLPVSLVWAHPTIEDLAEALASPVGPHGGTASPGQPVDDPLSQLLAELDQQDTGQA